MFVILTRVKDRFWDSNKFLFSATSLEFPKTNKITYSMFNIVLKSMFRIH